MRLFYFIFTILFLSACSSDVANNTNTQQNDNYSQQTPIKNVKLKNYNDTVNYALGVVIASQMKKYGITQINDDVFQQAIEDGLTLLPQELQIDPEVAKKIISLYVKNTTSQKLFNDLNANEQFFKDNASKTDVKTLSNGLQYKIITSGSGKTPNLDSKVTVNYSGKLINGDIFVNPQQPVTFVVRNSLKGWQSALTRMKEGDRWIIYIPPELAFGNKGNQNVPPNSVVIYDIELLDVK